MVEPAEPGTGMAALRWCVRGMMATLTVLGLLIATLAAALIARIVAIAG